MVKKVMLVDDNPDLLFSIKNGLENANPNFNVETVDSGEKCLDMLKNDNIPDVILLDIMMPGISGWETFDKIQENKKWQKIPIIFLTARTDKVAKNAGNFLAKDYIEKPFDIADLNKRINNILQKNPI